MTVQGVVDGSSNSAMTTGTKKKGGKIENPTYICGPFSLFLRFCNTGNFYKELFLFSQKSKSRFKKTEKKNVL